MTIDKQHGSRTPAGILPWVLLGMGLLCLPVVAQPDDTPRPAAAKQAADVTSQRAAAIQAADATQEPAAANLATDVAPQPAAANQPADVTPRRAAAIQAADDTKKDQKPDDATSDDRLGIQSMCTNCNEANLELGGLDDSHIGVLFDGFSLDGGLPRIFALAILPAPERARMDVTTGAGRAEQESAAVGGEVALRSRGFAGPPQLSLAGELGNFGWSKQALSASARRGSLAGRLVTTHSSMDAIDADGDGNVETGRDDQWSGLAEVQLDLRRAGRLVVGATRIEDDQVDGHGQVELDLSLQPIGYLHEDTFVNWQEYHFGYDLPLSAKHSLRLRASRFDREQRIVAPAAASFDPKLERYLIDQRVKRVDLRWEGGLGERWWLTAGAVSKTLEVGVEGAALPIYQPNAVERVRESGGFLQAEVSLAPSLSATLGGRYDSFDLDSGFATAADLLAGTTRELGPISRSKWSPRAEVFWKPTPSLQLKALAGYGFKAPDPAFTEICCGQSIETNAGLEPERSRSLALDLTYQPSPVWKANIYAHRTDFDDYIIKMVAGSVGLEQKIKQGNIHDATMTGISGLLSWKPGTDFSLSVSATHLEAKNNDGKITILANPNVPVQLLLPIELPMQQIPYFSEDSAQLTLRYAPIRAPLTLALSAAYTGPMLIQHYENIPFTPLPPGGLLEDYLRTPVFWTVNISGTVSAGKALEIYWGVDNVLNEVQDDLDDFTTDYNWGLIRGTYAYSGVRYTF